MNPDAANGLVVAFGLFLTGAGLLLAASLLFVFDT